MIKNDLQRIYRKLLIPIILLVAISVSLKIFLPILVISEQVLKVISILLFVLSAVSALIAPLLYRLMLIRRFREQQNVSRKDFLSFQKNTLCITLSTFYFFILALIAGASELVYLGIFLLALYSAYFYFPSQKHINFEMRLFRVEDR